MLFIYSCSSDDDAQDEQPTAAVFDPSPYALDLQGLPAPVLPEDNPLTIQGVKLGRMLFYEPMLSKDGVMTCASCHNQSNAFTDTARFSIGVEGLPGGRQAMSVFNMAWHSNEFFWDGRSHLLRNQSLKPIQDPLEMNETLENVVAKLSSSSMYKDQFIRAFDSDEITPMKMSLAMEQFMMTIVSGQSKYDKYLNGQAELTESELRGLALFETEYNPFFPDESGADCRHCHGGANFENDQYMNNGLDEEADIADYGREEATGMVSDRGKFKVPSLRNIAITQPYMHDGRFATLEEVVDHYNDGIHLSNSLDPALEATMATGLMLTDQDKTDLVNFLKTLTDEEFINNPEFSNPF
jgi:cytochrome c peroxidase